MGRKIADIYREYNTVPNLQQHMLWVAAVASLICDNFSEHVNKREIVTACILHDMGNIIKYDMNFSQELLAPEGKEYWQKVKDEYIKKYGTHEHLATLEIAEELGVSKKIIDFINEVDFPKVPFLLEQSIEQQIIVYADNRVDPFGIVSFRERLAEGRNRYKGKKEEMPQKQWDIVEEVLSKVERNIFSKCKIKPEDINNETVQPVIESLKNFVVE